MNEGGEDFEEWAPDFLEELIQVEERLSCATQNLKPNSSLLPSRQPPPPQRSEFVSYSPPRQLSQRPVDLFDRFSNALAPPVSVVQDDTKEQEIDRLKRELGRVSRQLTDRERECSELRKEITKKGGQIKSVYSNNEKIDVAVQGLKHANLEHGLLGMDTHMASSDSKNTKLLEEKIVHAIDAGVQTDNDGDCVKLNLEGDLSSHLDLQKKLLGIWSSTNDQSFGQNMISKLFMSCQRDFHLLFGCMSMKMSSKFPANSVACGSSSDATSLNTTHIFRSSEAAKVSHLFSVLTKICNGILPLESLFESLLDLCNLENVLILQSSLSILRALLRHLLSLGRNLEESALYSGTMSRLRGFSLATIMKIRVTLLSAGVRHLLQDSHHLASDLLIQYHYARADIVMLTWHCLM